MRALIVDDEKTVRLTLATALECLGHEVAMAADSASALNAIRSAGSPIDVILLDVRLSDENGLNLLGEIHRLSPHMPVMVITAYASIETAVEAMRRGAFDYIPKPCTPDQLRQSFARLERARNTDGQVTKRDIAFLADLPDLDLTTGSSSSAMQEALDIAFKAASSDATVLLVGESGTGKSSLARAIHRHGPRAPKPFVPISCQNHSADAIEISLFGHGGTEVAAAGGKIAAAEGGTLYLDEISRLPAEAQAKLLRLLQERAYERVGEAETYHADVRIVAASSQDIQKAVTEGKFRNDLYYRLSVIPITLPPLRGRIGDIDLLAGAYLEFFAHHYDRPLKHLTAVAIRKLRQYEWPGNLRELCNVIERAVILSNGDEIDIADLPSAIRFATEGHSVRKSTLEEVQNEHIRHVLANTASLQEASLVLGIDPATLYRKRKKLGV